MNTDNDQIAFWRGTFGDAYTERNRPNDELVKARSRMWSRIMANFSESPPESILEVGANLGTNLRALKTLTNAELFAAEPNKRARQCLIEDKVLPEENVEDAFAANLPFSDGQVDLAFTSGVLIHIHPDDLLSSCREIYRIFARYLVCIEYFSDKSENVIYGDQEDRLFKRDFGGFWLDNFSDLEVLDYGFAWKRATGLDNLTWWVFEKKR